MLKYFEKELNKKLEKYGDGLLFEAIKYSMTVGGKRIRPLIVLNLAKSLGYDYTKFIDLAIAIEFIHNYSLVHDDLPCMDNDKYRRGKLTTHYKYGEYIGVLVGDALLTDAMNILSSSKTLQNKSKIIELITDKIGSNGMILGQVLDMQNDVEKIEMIHYKKTTNLIEACFSTVLIELRLLNNRYMEVAKLLGEIYQIQDDIFDADSIDDNSNYAKNFGYEKAKNEIEIKREKICKNLEDNKEFLEFILKIVDRKN